MSRKSQRLAVGKEIEQEVWDILDMFRALRQSYEKLPDKSGINEELINFDGFDANNEEEHLQAARRIAVLQRGRNVPNSHMPRLGGYRMMLRLWRNSPDKKNLTKDDILHILRPERVGE